MRLVSGASVTAAIAAAALAGCTSGGSGTTSASGSNPPTPAASDAASPAASGSSGSTSGSSSGSSTTGSSGGTGTASTSQCQTRNLTLRVLQGPQEEGSTTNSFYVELTNTSATTCTLYGFPGVELIGGAGGTPKPLGMRDSWEAKLGSGGVKRMQTLSPHTASAAYVTFTTRDPGASADIPRAQEVQVIPPNQRTALTARIYNVDSGYVTPLITSKTLTVGPMDLDAVPHK